MTKGEFNRFLKGIPLAVRMEVELHASIIDILVKERKWDGKDNRKLRKIQADAYKHASAISSSMIKKVRKWKKDKAPLKSRYLKKEK